MSKLVAIVLYLLKLGLTHQILNDLVPKYQQKYFPMHGYATRASAPNVSPMGVGVHQRKTLTHIFVPSSYRMEPFTTQY